MKRPDPTENEVTHESTGIHTNEGRKYLILAVSPNRIGARRLGRFILRRSWAVSISKPSQFVCEAA
jgi:hypothetical protein